MLVSTIFNGIKTWNAWTYKDINCYQRVWK